MVELGNDVSGKCNVSVYTCGLLIRKGCFLLEYHVWKTNTGDCQQSLSTGSLQKRQFCSMEW